MILTEECAALFNGAWRGGFGPSLSARDKSAFATRYGVDVRTVQRWSTQAGEQRNPFPRTWIGRDLADVAPYAAQLARDTMRLAAPNTRVITCHGSLENAHIRYLDATQAIEDLEEWGFSGDIFRDQMISEASYYQDEGTAAWFVVYCREYDNSIATGYGPMENAHPCWNEQ